jgi:hypothetical protein
MHLLAIFLHFCVVTGMSYLPAKDNCDTLSRLSLRVIWISTNFRQNLMVAVTRTRHFHILLDSSKTKTLWKLLLLFSQIVHQRVSPDQIKKISNFQFWRRVLDFYSLRLLMSLRILDITVLGFLIQWNHVTYIWVPFFVQFSVPFLAPSCVPCCAVFRVPYFIQFQFSVPFRALFCLPCSALLSHLRPVLCFLLGSVLSVRLHSVVCSLLGSVMFHFAFPICVPFCVTSFWVPFSSL